MKTFRGTFTRIVDHVNYRHELEQEYEVIYDIDEEGFVTITQIEEKPDESYREVLEDSWLWADIKRDFRTDVNDVEVDDDIDPPETFDDHYV